MVNNIFVPRTAQLPYCILSFVPSYPMPGMTDTDFVDTFLAFRKGVLLITTFFVVYVPVFLHSLIFYQPVWTPNWTTFQTVENNFPDRASIFWLSTETILLSSGEQVSDSVEPWSTVLIILKASIYLVIVSI